MFLFHIDVSLPSLSLTLPVSLRSIGMPSGEAKQIQNVEYYNVNGLGCCESTQRTQLTQAW